MLIDSHCHLDDNRFDGDRDAVMARANAVGIRQFVVPATTRQRWSEVEVVADSYDGVHPAYGLHPMFMSSHRMSDLDALDEWLANHQSVAVGECGLDFFHSNEDEAEQLELFRGQLTIAANHHLPLIVHVRKGLDSVLREIRRSDSCRGVVHSFSGSLQQAQQLFDLGFRLGIAATVSFERARKLRDVVAQIDMDALLIETDAPDQAGAQHRGQRNEPAYLVDHLVVMAELRGMDAKSLGQRLNANAQALFGLD